MYQLAAWYKESAAESGVEIVFVSLDKTSDDFAESFDSRHPWLALPFGRRDLNKLICDAVAQEGEIPSLAVFSDTAEIQAVVAWRNENEPDVDVWLSEFGWDTDPHSPNRVPVYGGHTANEVQGMWIARAFLVLAANGLERAHQFMLRDTTEGGWVQFMTSGLVTTMTSSPPWAPKPSWYMVKTLVSALGHMRFARWTRGSA